MRKGWDDFAMLKKWTEEEVSKMGFDGFRVEYKGFLEAQPLYIYAWWSAAGQK